jgi:hypothetical protein
MKPDFNYIIGQNVKLSLSGESGDVIGRAEYKDQPPSYYVRYLAADGCQVKEWLNDDDLQPA